MSINPRKLKYFKRKFAAYIVLLGILGGAIFVLNTFFTSSEPLFISPIGKTNIDLAFVEKILKDKNILFSQASLSDYSYLINIQNNGQVRLSQNKDVDKQISSLQKILRELTIEGRSFKSIDFRFEEPIVAF
jgi:hypothetical protein